MSPASTLSFAGRGLSKPDGITGSPSSAVASSVAGKAVGAAGSAVVGFAKKAGAWTAKLAGWLGNKTRRNEPHWVTLLDSNWLGWADSVLGVDYAHTWVQSSRAAIKGLYAAAINKASMRDLMKLDSLYAQEKLMK